MTRGWTSWPLVRWSLVGVVLVILGVALASDPSRVVGRKVFHGPSATTPTTVLDTYEMTRFSSAVLEDTTRVWRALFEGSGRVYAPPAVAFFSPETDSAVDAASSDPSMAQGSAYRAGTRTVYIDLTFYDELSRRFGPAGDIAQAYVIAHEVGHHVQRLLGVTEQLERMRPGLSEAQYRGQRDRQELQADFLAGVWAHHARRHLGVIEPDRAQEAIEAAAAVGQDRLSHGRAASSEQDSFTHATAAQRMRWFTLGLETGDLSAGDVFSADLSSEHAGLE